MVRDDHENSKIHRNRQSASVLLTVSFLLNTVCYNARNSINHVRVKRILPRSFHRFFTRLNKSSKGFFLSINFTSKKHRSINLVHIIFIIVLKTMNKFIISMPRGDFHSLNEF